MARLGHKLNQRITLTLSVRALAIAVVVVVAVFSFLIYGAYQGIQANHNNLQAQQASTQRLHEQRLADDAAAKKAIDASFCDVVYFFDAQGVKNAPFLEHVRDIHNCDPASAHPAPKGRKPVAPSKLPAAKSGLGAGNPGNTGGNGGTSGGGSHPTPTPTPTHPKPSPKPTPTPTPKPILPLGPVVTPVCKLINPILGTCILSP